MPLIYLSIYTRTLDNIVRAAEQSDTGNNATDNNGSYMLSSIAGLRELLLSEGGVNGRGGNCFVPNDTTFPSRGNVNVA